MGFTAIGFFSIMVVPTLFDDAHAGLGITIGLIAAAIFFIWAIVLFLTNIVKGIKLLII